MEDAKQIDDLALQLLLARLDTQDKAMEGTNAKQDATLREVRKTNGSVIELKARVGALEDARLSERVTGLEGARLVSDGTAAALERTSERRRDRWRFAVTGLYILGGACAAGIGHALHLW